MSNQHTQYFTVTINYEGDNPDTFDAETVGDCVYDNLAESDLIDRLDTIETIEEHRPRPTEHDLENLRFSYTPAATLNLAGVDLAVVALITETLDYATGRTTIEELHEAVKRARHIATPVTPDNLEARRQPLPVPAHQN